MNTNDFSYAAKFRDVINKMITAQVDKIRPRPSVGIVTAVNNSNRTVLVLYPGDTVSVPVSYGALVPGVGATVLIDGVAERRYVADVISGPFTSGEASGALSGIKFLGSFRFNSDGWSGWGNDAITQTTIPFPILIVPLQDSFAAGAHAKSHWFDILIPEWAGLISLQMETFIEVGTLSGGNVPSGVFGSMGIHVAKQNSNGSFSVITGNRTINSPVPLPPALSTTPSPNYNWRASWSIIFAPISYKSPPAFTTPTTSGNVGIGGTTERLYLAGERIGPVSGETIYIKLQSCIVTVFALGTSVGLPQLF